MSKQAQSTHTISACLKTASFEELPELLCRYAADPRQQVHHVVEVAQRRYERQRLDRKRVRAMYELQERLGGQGVIVGVDEVGRGALAGPLTVAAVVLPRKPAVWGLNDSKRLSAQQREKLALCIKEVASAVGIAHVQAADIDRYGMSASLRKAMASAVANTGVDPGCVLIDGNPVHAHPKEKTLIKGDAKVADIAAASIVAKVTRDHIMMTYDEAYPDYHFAACKGYGSAAHIAAIKRHGLCPIHRASFCTHFIN
ncbi:MAG: ribonuclease HII [Atopobiaceae bacterium]|jgi:ribonuclease HII|nr:ribonuclease HII [Atopobiaceae bacterium]